MVVSAVLACLGQTCWKVGATHGPWWVVGGLGFYATGALLMLLAYRHGELSVLQPILGVSYALAVVIGALWLGEQVSAGRVVGVLLVMAGVALVARTRHGATR